MALQVDERLAPEEARIQPHLKQLKAVVRRYDPDAQFALSSGHVPEFWELDARVRPDLAEDADLRAEVANRQTATLLEHDVAIAVLLLPREG